MEKLRLLIENYPDEVNKFVDELYLEKFTKKSKSKKTIFMFKVLGKEYNSTVFTKNYIEFIRDISNIHPYEMFKNTPFKSYIGQSEVGMTQSHKIKDNFFVSSASSTEVKIKQIKELCEFLGVTLTEI